MRRRIFLLLAGAAVLCSACIPMPKPYPYRNALTPGLKPPVTLIGDSTMAAMVWYADAGRQAQAHLQAAYSATIVAQSCQRLVGTSCGGRFGGRPPTTHQEMLRRAGRLGEAVVVMAGYDDVNVGPGVDAIMNEAIRQGVPYVLFLTYRANVNYVLPGGARARNLYTTHNAVLQERAQRYPTMRIADWNAHTAAHPEWFSSDGIHLSPSGTVELSRFIRAYLDSLPLGRCLPSEAMGGPVTNGPAWTGVSGAGMVNAPAPITLLDTRPGGGDPHVKKVGANRMVQARLTGAVPAGAPALRVRITAVDPCRNGQINIARCGQNPRTGPGVFFQGGRTVRYDTTVPGAAVCAWVSAPADVVVQVIGWVPPQ
jgi:hypothetical protein